ncbi:MAG TPA: dihydropteroate synthase [Hyphomicrobiaceae bacterium]|nr:dihydropteroate synthase [Hyphomicrobiaceae bacterium]
MTSATYLRPLGGLTAPAALSRRDLLRVAGQDHLAFAAAEVIERRNGNIHRTVHTAADVRASADPEVRRLLVRLAAPRGAIAGLSLDRPRIMGIVNVTPDSFSDGGEFLDPDAAVAHALRLDAEGADIIDIGAESTRPGAEPIGTAEEWRRCEPVLTRLAGRTRARLSIDTRNGETMRRAAAAGVHMINDVSALSHDPDSLRAAAATGLPVVLMHTRGDPRTMQDNPVYEDVVLDVYDALVARIAACESAGIERGRLVVDPGIGFGKTPAHNLALIGALSMLHGLGCAVMLGASRKSFIARLTGAGAMRDRLAGSLAAALHGVQQGVQILRVHDVAATRQALAIWEGAT